MSKADETSERESRVLVTCQLLTSKTTRRADAFSLNGWPEIRIGGEGVCLIALGKEASEFGRRRTGWR